VLVPRARGGAAEAERDHDMLGWIARFRFVTAELLRERFGVSRQQVNAQLRRLESAGMVVRRAEAAGQAWTVSASARGLGAMGLPRRRPARSDVQREHELALVWLVAQLERRGNVLWTQREGRAREAAGEELYSVDVIERGGRREKRWPDLVLEQPGRRVAVDHERTAKGRDRLDHIVAGYRVAAWFDEVQFFASEPDVARNLARALAKARSDRLSIAPWPGLRRPQRALVQAALGWR
jgi:hypothetical protein